MGNGSHTPLSLRGLIRQDVNHPPFALMEPGICMCGLGAKQASLSDRQGSPCPERLKAPQCPRFGKTKRRGMRIGPGGWPWPCVDMNGIFPCWGIRWESHLRTRVDALSQFLVLCLGKLYPLLE
jgi:hypothetical protein